MAKQTFLEAVNNANTLPVEEGVNYTSVFDHADVFDWLRNPVNGSPPLNVEQLSDRATDYFMRCADCKVMPSLTGLTLALGLSSVTSIHGLGIRKPEMRWALSRCLTAISYYYEMGMALGEIKSAVSTFMLKHLNTFDADDPEGTPATVFWSDKQVVDIQINANVNHKVEKISPEEAYARLVKGEEISNDTIDAVLLNDQYVVEQDA